MRNTVRHVMLCLGIMTNLCGCSTNQYKPIDLEDLQQKETASSGSVEPGEGSVIKIENEEPADEENQAVLLFAGDILLSDHVLKAYQQAGGIHGVLDEGYRSLIAGADSFIANQEFPFSDRGTAAADKEFTFRLAPEKVSVFQEVNLDIVSLANNHALDFGRDALEDTITTLDLAGIAHIGAGNNLDEAKTPVIREVGGITVGFLGATRVIPAADWAAGRYNSGMLATYDPAELLAAIKELRKNCDYLVIYVHWGVERATIPESYQRSLGQQYIDAGADLVVGSHPHVLQGIEYYKGKPIVYSLGNFIFGSSIPQTAMLQVEVREDKTGVSSSLSLIPGTSVAGYTKTITDDNKLKAFYQQMESISFDITFHGEGAVRTVVQTE